MPNTKADGASHIAEKIKQNIIRLAIAHDGSPNHKIVTLSLGVGTCSSLVKIYEDLIKKSDIALYKAKANGRNRVEVYKEDSTLQSEDMS